MPLRNERAKLYREKHGVSPSDDCLFLSKKGRPITYSMLYDHFKKIEAHPDYVSKSFTPKMLRHSWATYFVYEALKKDKSLNSDYVYNSVVQNPVEFGSTFAMLGTKTPNKPRSARPFSAAFGKVASRSHAAACGVTSAVT